MTLVLSVIAVLAAMGSLWFASSALHRTEENLDEITRAIRTENKKNREALEGRFAGLENQLNKMQREINLETSTREKLTTQLNQVKKETDALKFSFGELDESIPQQLRRLGQREKHPN